jgi:hypothetical protein
MLHRKLRLGDVLNTRNLKPGIEIEGRRKGGNSCSYDSPGNAKHGAIWLHSDEVRESERNIRKSVVTFIRGYWVKAKQKLAIQVPI